MNIRKLILSCLKNTCIFFTFIALGYSLIMWFIYGTENQLVLIPANNLLYYFVFSLLVSFANGILSIQKMSKGIRVILHYIICTFGFYACFLLPLAMRGAQIFIGIVFFSLIYWPIMGIIALFAARFKINQQKNEAYTKQYQKKKK